MSHPRNAKGEARRERRQDARTSPVRRIIFPSLAASLALIIAAPAVSGATAANPYLGIVERNVFSLKPPPPPGPPPETPKPASKLTLTGITTILNKKQALLTAAIPAIGTAQPAKQESYILAEGQRDGDVEVVSIDEIAGIVKVINRGLPETLDFVNNGAKIVSTGPGPGGVPGSAPGVQPQGIPAPQPGAIPGGMRQIPPRVPRPTQPSGANPGQQQPGMGMTGGGPSPNAQPSQFNNSLNSDEQTALIELQRMKHLQEGNQDAANMFPVTEATEEVNRSMQPQ
jgi:hypothetical protein